MASQWMTWWKCSRKKSAVAVDQNTKKEDSGSNGSQESSKRAIQLKMNATDKIAHALIPSQSRVASYRATCNRWTEASKLQKESWTRDNPKHYSFASYQKRKSFAELHLLFVVQAVVFCLVDASPSVIIPIPTNFSTTQAQWMRCS